MVTKVTIEDLKKKLESIEELPALPTIVVEINQLLSNPKTTAPELSRTVMRDPALTAKILKITNSSFFGMPKRISSVNQAIIVLGFNTVRSIAVCTAVIEAFSAKPKTGTAITPKEFWQYSVSVAAACRVLARNAELQKTDAAFVSGLLHGVGKITLDQFFHKEFVTAIEQARTSKIALWSAEYNVFAFSDAMLGGALLDMWKLDPAIVKAVTYQENPPEAAEHAQLAAFNLIGGVIARVLNLGNSGDTYLARITPEVLQLAKVEEVQWPRLLELTADEAKKAAVFSEM